jgi:hypothetical protein
MAKSNSKRKTRSDKFLLTLHKTGQYCKKIKGKIYYFGTEKSQALNRYLKQASYLHIGNLPKPEITQDLSIRTLCNLYLDQQESRACVGEIKWRQVCDPTRLLRDFAKYIGPNKAVSLVSTIDLQNYRTKLIKSNKAPTTINNHIAAVKAMYNWADHSE